MKIRVLFLCVLLFSCMPYSAAFGVKLFDKDSYSSILKRYQGKSFVLALWSVDCHPCQQELQLLGKLHTQVPEVPIVLISVDGAVVNHVMESILRKYALTTVDQWVFSGTDPAVLRFQIDPAWYGDIPRTYLINAHGERKTIIGATDCRKVINWVQQRNNKYELGGICDDPAENINH